ncbi:uncharacterized protein LOC133527483 [Cydia pomonella]|uniref:uncharacterized protein LOC133527483 n=1 Tax=Cydia pomonella TaxID=82600 RepID=UPI002ADDB5CC|nr:uncharacterized protein LOC133527483 [Cydia pomonella]
MKGRHITMFMISMTLAYSAPTRNFMATVNVSTTYSPTSTSDFPQGHTPDKRNLRSETDNTPGRCCSSDLSKKCCPYDYDDNKCGISDNRTLCGYNKNQKKPVIIKTTTVKYGLICWLVNDRLECGYAKGSPVTDLSTQELMTRNVKMSTTVTSEKITSKGTIKTSTETTTKTTKKSITTTKLTTETPEKTTSTTTKSKIKTTQQITASGKTAVEEPTSQTGINIPGNCCSSNSSISCCPYDYDDSKCDISDNRTLCGYNKNQKKPDANEATKQFTKQGLNCQHRDERVECEYNKRFDSTDSFTPSTKPHVKQRLGLKIRTKHKLIREMTSRVTEASTTTATKEIKTRTTQPVKPKLTTGRRTTIECVEIHSKKACRVIPIDEELNYD